MSAHTPVLAQVPCAKGRRLHISWGTGDQLLLSPIAGAQGASKEEHEPVQTTSTVKWYEISKLKSYMVPIGFGVHRDKTSTFIRGRHDIDCRNTLAASERRVAYDSLPSFQALHTKRHAGEALVQIAPYNRSLHDSFL